MTNSTLVSVLIDAAELARMLSVSKPTVWRMKDAGKLPPEIRLSAQAIRWNRGIVLDWIERGCPPQAATQINKTESA